MNSVHPFRAWRKRHGVTLTRAAAYSGVTASMIGRMERGQHTHALQAKTVFRLSRITNGEVSAEAILDFHAYATGGPTSDQMHPFKIWRYRNGVYTTEAARRAGIAVPTLTQMEACVHSISQKSAENLSRMTNGELSPELIRNFHKQKWRRHGTEQREGTMKAETAPNLSPEMVTGGAFAGRRAMVASCSNPDCNKRVRFITGHRKTPPTEYYHNRLRADGWLVSSNGRKQICPKCQEKRKVRKEGTLSLNPTAPASPPAANEAPAPEPERQITPADRRNIMNRLADQFDVGRGVYRLDHSDSSVAEALGVPVAAVAEIREFMFGPLKVDVEMDRAKKRIAHLEARIGEFEKMGETVIDEIDKARKEMAEVKALVLARAGGPVHASP